jgi:hypothetical protein
VSSGSSVVLIAKTVINNPIARPAANIGILLFSFFETGVSVNGSCVVPICVKME